MMVYKNNHKLKSFLPAVIMSFVSLALSAQINDIHVKINGAAKFQTLDGFGVNVNTTWWYNGSYGDAAVMQPAIDLLVDSMGAAIFRAVIEEIDWEEINDDPDPDHFNWDYYDHIFSNARFQGVWKTLQYLNKKGITDRLMISFMGGPPAGAPMTPPDQEKSWMGGTDYSIDESSENELVESIAALLYYARNTADIQFTLVSPLNETDIISNTKSAQHPDGIVEGPNIPDAVQYTRIVKKLAEKLDMMGMSDIRFVVPDAGGEDLFRRCMNEMVKDSYLMGKLACWGVHQYGDNAENYKKLVSRPDQTNKNFWVTETAGIKNIFGQLDDDVKACIFWDGFDCVYQHARRNGYGDTPPNDWVFWYEEEGKPFIEYVAETKSWVPRKQFYEFAQIFKFIKPGAVRIEAEKQNDDLIVYAFQNPNNQLVIVGQNKSDAPVEIKGTLENLPGVSSLEMFITDSLKNLGRSKGSIVSENKFSAIIPGHAIFTLTDNILASGSTLVRRLKPEPVGWYSGDMHIHRDCGGHDEDVLSEEKFVEMMEVNDLDVISVLADMGNGEVKFADEDLLKVTGEDAPQSLPGRTVHWDAEWHWDPYGVTFEHKALGGHVVLLGMQEARKMWEESTWRILEYGKNQNAVVGFCHLQYLNDSIQNNLNCCIPIEHVTEMALGTVDFIAEDVYSSSLPNNGTYSADATIHAFYKFLNCGFRPGLVAGTDYPCNSFEPFGSLLTYVRVDGPFSYRKWVEGIRDGKTVVARNGHREFLDLKVNGQYQPGDDIHFSSKDSVRVEVKWTSVEPAAGSIEIVQNGCVVATLEGTAKPGFPVVFRAIVPVIQSSWLCARRMNEKGHQTHTAPVYLTMNNKPVRASAQDARFFIDWIDNMLKNTSLGGEWSQYFPHNLDEARARYNKAKEIYVQIEKEASENQF